MQHYGLIGFPLEHSFSKRYFQQKFSSENIEADYHNFPLESIEELMPLLAEHPLNGFNVTIPYKESVLEYLDEIDPEAEAIGAVNCVKITNGKRCGYNTDVHGFVSALLQCIEQRKPKALILGTGGSSKAVARGLEQLDIPYHFVSRRKKAEWFTYQEITPEVLHEYQLLINTTPLGMWPSTTLPDLPYHELGSQHVLFDLIYNPEETPFLSKGKEQGATICNGLTMLHAQAEKNWEIWQQ
ncbi:MAG: shikimate dehydrogenase [Chitinophagales bacterium]